MEMLPDELDLVRLTPDRIAAVYLLVSVVWILVTDTLVFRSTEVASHLYLQEVSKGVVFVAGSALLVYVLTSRYRTGLERTNDRLRLTVQQVQLLQRVLRHTLRNSCTVIRGQAEHVRDESDGTSAEASEVIIDSVDSLLTVSEQSRYIAELAVEHSADYSTLRVAPVVEQSAATVRERYPDASVEVECDADPTALVPMQFEVALTELVENAVEHNDDPAPTVRVTLVERAGQAVVTVGDDGPGLPETERRVLEEGTESPVEHSQGLGLWLARLVAVAAGGSVAVESSDLGGTAIVVELPVDSGTESRLPLARAAVSGE